MDVRAAIAQILKASTRTLIVCHTRPDGDCLGSGLALGLALRQSGRPATVASADGVPEGLRFLPGAGGVITAVPPDPAYDVAVTIECSTLDRAGTLAGAVARASVIVAVDHHEDHRPYAHLTDWDPAAAAVGELVADLIDRLGIDGDRDISTHLLTALVTDTGAFRFPNTSARALRLAADLVERGASVAEIVRAVYEDQPPSAFRLLGRALAALELHAGGRVARCVIPLSMLDSAGAAAEESAGIVGVLRAIRGVRVALVVQEGAGVVYVSVRSREPARANAVAAALGGGGHPAAAGAEVDGTIDHVARLALDAAVREAERGGP